MSARRSPSRTFALVALAHAHPSTALAQDAPSPAPPTPPADAPPADPTAPPKPAFEPPTAIGATDVPYPADAPAHDAPIVVTVKLLVDTSGAVAKVEPITPAQPVFDEAVQAAVKTFRFAPGRYGGTPVPVEITFTHTFLPPPPPPPPAGTSPHAPPPYTLYRNDFGAASSLNAS